MRPGDPRATDHRWRFIRRCWSSFGTVLRRPACGEMVAFSRAGLVQERPRIAQRCSDAFQIELQLDSSEDVCRCCGPFRCPNVSVSRAAVLAD